MKYLKNRQRAVFAKNELFFSPNLSYPLGPTRVGPARQCRTRTRPLAGPTSVCLLLQGPPRYLD
jgi:hypothetical protein